MSHITVSQDVVNILSKAQGPAEIRDDQGNINGIFTPVGRSSVSGKSRGSSHEGSRRKLAAPTYSMVIQWSEQDQVFITSLPEFGGCKTHGKTPEEAARMGQEAIRSLILAYRADGQELPTPQIYSGSMSTETKPRERVVDLS